MSFYSQSCSFYSQTGWPHFGARTPAPPREAFALPLSYTVTVAGVTLGITTISPIWF